MHAKQILALGAFISAVTGAPIAQREQKRDLEVITRTQDVVVTVPVTKTVYVTFPADPTATATVHPASYQTSNVQTSPQVHSTVTSQPSPYQQPTTMAPEPTTTAQATSPVTTSTPPAQYTPSSSTSIAPSPSPTYTSSSNDGTTGLTYGPASSGTSFADGELTWYQTGLGACGLTSSPSDYIVAVSHDTFDAYDAEAGSDPNHNPICGKTVTITGADGSQYTATIVDRCVGCDPDHLDLSEDFFNTVTNNANGVMNGVSWRYD